MNIQRPIITLDGIIFGLQAFGGISNYWGRLTQHLAGMPSVDCYHIVPRHVLYKEYQAREGEKNLCIRESRPARLTRYLTAPNRTRAGIFHTSYYRLPARPVERYVVTAYDFIYERYRRGLARWVHSTQKLRSLTNADAVICISEATRNDVLHYCTAVDPARVHVVHLGVDHETFYPTPRPSDNACSRTVLYVGQRGGYKRFDLAVEAIAQCPELSLGIVGPPLTADECASVEKALPGRWKAFGSVPVQRLRELYSSSFAFVFPSSYEGFGLPVLEAMACGCPVVAAAAASLPEVGGAAAIYPDAQHAHAYAAAFRKLLDNESIRNDAIASGLRRVHEFSWERTFSETLSVYGLTADAVGPQSHAAAT